MANLGKVALAMLGILAYQNRDKIGELLRGNDRTGVDRDNPQRHDGGGLIEQITDTLGSGSGLEDILDRFRQSGSGEQADSWVRRGPNQTIDRQQVEAAIDPDTISELSAQTGLSRDELLERIARDLPEAVDKMTPDGQLQSVENSEPAKPSLLDPVPPKAQ